MSFSEQGVDNIVEGFKQTIRFYRNRPPMTSNMLVWAFRYCLKESSYAATDCINYLVLYWDRIAKGTRDMVIEELFRACDKNHCKIEMDKSAWRRVLEREGLTYTKSNGWRKEKLCTSGKE